MDLHAYLLTISSENVLFAWMATSLSMEDAKQTLLAQTVCTINLVSALKSILFVTHTINLQEIVWAVEILWIIYSLMEDAYIKKYTVEEDSIRSIEIAMMYLLPAPTSIPVMENVLTASITCISLILMVHAQL